MYYAARRVISLASQNNGDLSIVCHAEFGLALYWLTSCILVGATPFNTAQTNMLNV